MTDHSSPENAVWDFAKAILHGDDEHRGWLLEAAAAFEAGKPIPAPRGSGIHAQQMPTEQIPIGYIIRNKVTGAIASQHVVSSRWEAEDWAKTFKPEWELQPIYLAASRDLPHQYAPDHSLPVGGVK